MLAKSLILFIGIMEQSFRWLLYGFLYRARVGCECMCPRFIEGERRSLDLATVEEWEGSYWVRHNCSSPALSWMAGEGSWSTRLQVGTSGWIGTHAFPSHLFPYLLNFPPLTEKIKEVRTGFHSSDYAEYLKKWSQIRIFLRSYQFIANRCNSFKEQPLLLVRTSICALLE